MNLTTTTLSADVLANDQTVKLASVTPLTPEAIKAGILLFFDGEAARVLSVSGSQARVQRGVSGTVVSPHASGLTVYFATATQLYTQDPIGEPPPAGAPILPWINVTNNRVWTVVSGVWVQTSAGGSAPTPPPGLDTQVIFNDGGVYGAMSSLFVNKTALSATEDVAFLNVGTPLTGMSAFVQDWISPFAVGVAGVQNGILSMLENPQTALGGGAVTGLVEYTSASNGGSPGGVRAGAYFGSFLSGKTTASVNHLDSLTLDLDMIVTDATDYRATGAGYTANIFIDAENTNGGKLNEMNGIRMSLSPGDTTTVYGIQIYPIGAGATTGVGLKIQSSGHGYYSIVTGTDPSVFGGDVTAPNFIVSGSRFKSDTTTGHTGGLAVYDVNGAAYRDFLVWTNADAPAVVMSIPTTGTLDITATTVKASLQTTENASTGLVAGVLAALTNASITITDGSGQAYRIPVII